MDPQQRLLLEATYDAIGAGPSTAADSQGAKPMPPKHAADTGVFVGASYAEWMLVQQGMQLPQSSYTASGSGLSVLSGGRHVHQAPCFRASSANPCPPSYVPPLPQFLQAA